MVQSKSSQSQQIPAVSDSATRQSSSVITVLQAGRAIAAILVVAHHAARSTGDFVGNLPGPLAALLDRGYLGVDFFFVLSGFIIYHSNSEKRRASDWSSRYVESRLIRVFVPYLPVGVLIALAYLVFPQLSASERFWGWFSTLTLLPSSMGPALVVAWSLQHELIFYSVFWLSALVGRPICGVFIWATALVAIALIAPGMQVQALAPILGVINVEFLFGVLAARALSQRALGDWVFLSSSFVLFGLYLLGGAVISHRIIFAAGIALLLVPMIRYEQAGRISAPTSLVYLGNASYAIYLLHNPAIALSARVVGGNWVTALSWFVGLGVCAGIAYYEIVEKPAISIVKRWAALLSADARKVQAR